MNVVQCYKDDPHAFSIKTAMKVVEFHIQAPKDQPLAQWFIAIDQILQIVSWSSLTGNAVPSEFTETIEKMAFTNESMKHF